MLPTPAPEVSCVGRHVNVAAWRQPPKVRNAEPHDKGNFHSQIEKPQRDFRRDPRAQGGN